MRVAIGTSGEVSLGERGEELCRERAGRGGGSRVLGERLRRRRRTGTSQARGPEDGWTLSPLRDLAQFFPDPRLTHSSVLRCPGREKGRSPGGRGQENQAKFRVPDHNTVTHPTTGSLVATNYILSPRGKLRQRGRNGFLAEVGGGLVLRSFRPAYHR